MANEFVARRGIIAQSGGAQITGSLIVSGAINAAGYIVTAQGFTGSIAATNGVVSGASQVQSLLPGGTVSSSAQYPGWVTASSQVVWSQVNYSSGIVSSSAQVQPLLPGGTVSSSGQVSYTGLSNIPSGIVSSSTQFTSLTAPFTGSFTGSFKGDGSGITGIAGALPAGVISSSTQFRTITDPFTGSFTGSFAGTHTGTFPYNSLTGIPAGIVSSSTQVQPLLPAGTVSSSAQYPGWVTSSTQIVWSSVNYSSGIVSSSAQVTPLLPANTISSSTQFKTLTDPFTGSFTGSFTGDGSNLTNIATTLSFTGSSVTTPATANTSGSLNLRTQGLIVSASNGITATVSNNTLTLSVSGTLSSSTQVINSLPAGVISSSTQFKTLTDPFTGSFTGSFKGDGSQLTNINQSALPAGTVSSSTQIVWSQVNYNSGIVSSSTQVQTLLPANTISSSTQFKTLTDPFTGSFTGSFAGTHTGTFPYASLTGTPSGIVSSSTQVQTLLPAGTVSSSAQYPGWVTSSTQILNAISGQTITPATINATGVISGASIQTSGNGTIGGNLTVTGTITATSQSIQYVSSSQLNVATNKLILNTDNSLRFGGISIVDSGSVGKSGSLYWDSLNDRWLYEDVSGGVYNSAIIVAGPQNTGATGNERGLLAGRVPVASGDDHIDTAPASSSIRVDFPTRLTHVEAGLFVTGNLTANGTVTLQGIPSSSAQVATLLPANTVSSSGQVKAFLPGGTVSSSAQYPGWVTSSTQIVWSSVNYNTGIVSSSTQFKTITDPFTGSFTGSFAGTHTGTFPYNSLTGIPAGIVSSSTQVQPLLPGGTVSSSAQYPGWVTSSTQVVYTSLQSIPAGIVSSSTQVQPLLPAGTVSSSAQYPGWVTASSQIQLASITGTTFAAANFTFPQQLTVSGVLSGSTSAYITNTLYSGSTVTGIVGPVTNQVVASVLTGSLNSAHFDYVINDGTNYRTGTVMSVWSPSSIEFTETSTADLGNTAQATFTVDVLSGVARLRFSNVSGTWTVKTAVRAV